MDCNNAIGVVRVGGEVVVEAKEDRKREFIYFFAIVCGVVGRNRRGLLAIWPHT